MHAPDVNLLNDVFINQNTSLALEAFPFGPSPLQETFDIDRISPKEVAETLRSLPNINPRAGVTKSLIV